MGSFTPALALVAALLSADIVTARAVFPQSVPSPEATPGARNAHGAVYDSGDSTLVLFGGATASEVRSDTWLWRAGLWRAGPLAGPDPRTFPAMAYDTRRGEVVLYGGNRVLFGDSTRPPTMLADTWLLRQDGWIQISRDGPSARAEAAMSYDPRRGRTVLFGGRFESSGGRTDRLGDTWEWDGERWTRVSTTGPSPRSGAAMAFHPGLQVIVLFGGSGGPLGDTWSWDGRAWTRLPIPPAPGRFNTVMAWDPSARRLVRFGGWDGERRTSDTWQLTEREWIRTRDRGPAPRNHAVLVTAPDRSSVLLFGGHNGDLVFGDLWERRNRRWTRLEGPAPIARVANGH